VPGSRLAARGEDVVIANRGKPVVRLVKVEPATRRRAGAWVGLMTDAEIDHAFSLEVEAEFAREWQASIDRPIDAGLKMKPPPKRSPPARSSR
jgi:antitoxin (DNA-binding transcriptional repressor) of toxin-antitoxin stability system